MNIALYLSGWNRPLKVLFILTVDIIAALLAVWISYGLRLDLWGIWQTGATISLFVSAILYILFFFVFELNRVIYRFSYSSFDKVMIRPLLAYFFTFCLIFTIVGIDSIPRSIGILQPIFFFIILITSRWIMQNLYSIQPPEKLQIDNRILIYGAGDTGRLLTNLLKNKREIKIIGYIDDDKKLQGHTIDALKIYSFDELDTLKNNYEINKIFIAIPSITQKKKSLIYLKAAELKIQIKSTPSFNELIKDNQFDNAPSNISIDDLLGREEIFSDTQTLNENINNKTIAVTGAGGSIGSEISRQIANLNPKFLILIENNEYALYSIYEELKAQLNFQKTFLIPLLCSVTNRKEIERIFLLWKPDVVFHAAAFKHVPLIEFNQVEGLLNNTLGTLECAEAAIIANVKSFTLISTDKAVRPTNMLGASKRFAELILQGLDKTTTNTRLSIVRFGNVLGSSGSVVPLFKRQIERGGPITVTHPEVTRYFMTIPEASALVLEASTMSQGGEVFVLDMGKPVKILDLAKKMIALSSLNKNDIDIDFIGLRPGEKMFEELSIDGFMEPTNHKKIFKIDEPHIEWLELKNIIEEIKLLAEENNLKAISDILQKIISGYTPYPISDLKFNVDS